MYLCIYVDIYIYPYMLHGAGIFIPTSVVIFRANCIYIYVYIYICM